MSERVVRLEDIKVCRCECRSQAEDLYPVGVDATTEFHGSGSATITYHTEGSPIRKGAGDE